MKTAKRLLPLIFILATIVVMLVVTSTSASAEVYSGTCGKNLTWELDSGTGVLTISGTGDMYDYMFEVEYGEGHHSWLRTSAPWGAYGYNTVIINDGVTDIGDYAFFESSVSNVVIGDDVTSIGYLAFYNCRILKNINIPESVKSVGGEVFYGCSSLKTDLIPINGDYSVFCDNGYYSDEQNWYGGGFYIGDRLLCVKVADSEHLSVRHGTVKVYLEYPENDQKRHKTVFIPETVTSISGSAAKILCCENSYAHSYAVENNIPYELVHRCVFGAYTSDGNATCAKNGTQSAYCSYGCGVKSTRTEKGTATGNHSYDKTVEVAVASYTSAGKKYSFCSGCPAFNALTVDKLVPEITVEGNVVSITGAEYLNYIRYASGTHTTSDSIRNAPDCIGIGEAKITAGIVKGVFKKDITPEGTYSFWLRMTDNSTYIYTVKVNKPIHNHSYTSKVTKEATCTEEGVMTYKCSCGDSYTEALDKVPHKFTNYVYEDNGACASPFGEGATEAAYCDYGCGAVDRYEVPPQHVFVEWFVYEPATYFSEGQEISRCINCQGAHGGGAYTFRTIPKLVYENKFTDVKDSHWFADEVAYCVKRGYASGMTETTFAPNGKLTRAQFLTLLAKLDGVDLTQYDETNSGFADVKVNHWFNEVVCWAVEKGYTSGISETKFGPNNNVTRAQVARFFYVYCEKKGISITGRADLSVFPDAGKVASWAQTPIEWAVNAGLISGVKKDGVNILDPNGTATRAQATVMFKAFDDFRGING